MKAQVIRRHTELKVCFLVMPGMVVGDGVNFQGSRDTATGSWGDCGQLLSDRTNWLLLLQNLRNYLARWIQVCTSFEFSEQGIQTSPGV